MKVPWVFGCMGLVLLSGLLGRQTLLHAGGDPAKKELAKFQGAWQVEHLEYNGQDFSEKVKLTIVFKGNIGTVEANEDIKKEYAKIAIKIDPSTMPKLLDVDITGGVQKGAGMEGIYQWKGEELHFAVKVLGKDRPNEFKSPDGESIAYLRLKKAP